MELDEAMKKVEILSKVLMVSIAKFEKEAGYNLLVNNINLVREPGDPRILSRVNVDVKLSPWK